MKALSLCCIFLAACLSGRCAGNIDSLFKALNKGEVTLGAFPLPFSDFTGMDMQDTICYFIGDNMENAQIGYCQAKTDKYTIDMLHVNGRNYKLFADPEDDKKFDMQIDQAMLYRIRTKSRRYICITGVISQKEHITSYVLLDITDPGKIKVGQLLSYFSSIHSFADLNNDGELDFIKVRPNKRGGGYLAEACDLDGDNIVGGAKKRTYWLSLTMNDGVVNVLDEQWFL